MEVIKHKISPNQLNSIIVQNLPYIVDYLELDLKHAHGRFTGACPVHDGDSKKAFTIYEDDARWFCWSRHCEEDIGYNFINLLMKLKGWSYAKSTDWLSELEHDPNYVPIKRNSVDYVHNVSREEVRRALKIPSPYYLKKNFPYELLNEYDVGYCSDPNHFMFGRSVFPIYGVGGEFVGSTGRTIYPISNSNPKWSHYQIKTSNHLYNLHKAYPHIDKSKSVCLVESCANILRLVQYGILNCVGTFGAHLSRQQEIKIECTPAKKIYVLFDPDEAGKKAAERIMNKYGNKYEVIIPILDLNGDIADSSKEQIEKIKEIL